MEEHRHLRNAPATEALIDLQVELPPHVDPDDFLATRSRLGDRYPIVDPQKLFGARIKFEPAGDGFSQEGASRDVMGYWFRSEDRLNIAQFRLDGFTVNRLKPYTIWDDLVGEARTLWPEYIAVAAPIAVKRLAVRYINRFEITLPARLEDYLATTLQLPEPIPSSIRSFLWKWQTVDEDSGIVCNITQASEPHATMGDKLVIIFDIDCFYIHEYDPESPEIWNTLGALRRIKNKIFFNGLTPMALEMFD